MCGIFGYIGTSNQASARVIDGLKKLEYRGYDSWGVAAISDGELHITKDVGKISEVDSADFTLPSQCAIGHTRWATHGGVEQCNAHPHQNSTKTIAVVHNGIIENFTPLRNDLQQKGYVFASETDSEVVPHLIDYYMQAGNTFTESFILACNDLEGRYSLVAIEQNTQTIIAARAGSPLIVGVGTNEFFIGSDTTAFLEYTDIVNYIDDGEMIICDGKSVVCIDIKTKELQAKRNIHITWKPEEAEKGEFDHFMMKEIMDQKESVARAANQSEEQIRTIAQAIRSAKGTFIVGCGTAGKACMAAEYFFSVVAEHHVNFAPASEFKLYHHFLQSESLLIVVSQSGETADVLEAMETAKSKGAKVLAIVNVEGSTIDREADYTLLINAGPERAVASTKALTGQLAVLLSVAYALCDYPRDSRRIHSLHDGKTLLLETSAKINDMLNPRYLKHIEAVAEQIKQRKDMYIIGKSWNYPMALESAIKIQEVSYIHAEGFAGGELKHGPLALIEKGTPCIILAGNDEVTNDTINNAIEIRSRGAFTIGIAPQNNEAFDVWIKVPDAGHAQAIVNILPVQILSYYLSVKRGVNPDMPRNLAKSVTVK
jgi:glutamine---fructose-6-phosphate transaminase (isomerizing)